MLRRLSIRWRLAVITAGLTFVILCAFAVVIGQLTASRVRSDFQNELAAANDDLSSRLRTSNLNTLTGDFELVGPDLDVYAASADAVVRVLSLSGRLLASTKNAPNFGIILPNTTEVGGYRVETRRRSIPPIEDPRGEGPEILVSVIVQYARRVSDLEHTIQRVRLFLIFGVAAGTALALLGGLLLARRGLAPVARLTTTARSIAQTRDPSQSIPQPDADDEVAELARTLDEMLQGLASSRAETEAMLARQRQFVADASHELRTPLTSILANVELLADVLDGDRGEAARSALRSAQRMRRLVADLLLLARADAARMAPRAPTDLGRVLVEAAAELGPMSDGHELSIDARRAEIDGVRDELHRLAVNLIENALRHTPPGTQVRAAVAAVNGDVVLSVEDNGPGVPAPLRERIFERFVRGSGDHGSSVGLGLSIVRAVAESHGGRVVLETPATGGARFVVRLPRSAQGPPAGQTADTANAGAPA